MRRQRGEPLVRPVGPPPGLEGCQQPVDDGLEQTVDEEHDQTPWKIALPVSLSVLDSTTFTLGEPARVSISGLAERSQCPRSVPDTTARQDLRTFTVGEPARVSISGHAERSHCPRSVPGRTATQDLRTFEERLTCEVAEASRLLRQLAERRGEGPAELSGELMATYRDQFAELSENLMNNATGDVAALAAFALGCIENWETSVDSDNPRRGLSEEVRTMQNVIVLACSIGLTAEQLGGQGLPAVLRDRFASVLHEHGGVPKQAMEEYLSRLGTAKYHLFNPGVAFNRRPRKRQPASQQR